MAHLRTTAFARDRFRIAVPTASPTASATGSSGYPALLSTQGATSYWALDTARADTDTEPDLIGAVDMTMTGGASVAATAPAELENIAAAISLVDTDTESYEAGNTYDPDQDWSLSGWINLGTADTDVIFQLSNVDSNDYLYLIHRDDQSGLDLEISDGGTADHLNFGEDIEGDGQWHHVAVTRDYDATDTNDTWTLYLDGKQVAQSTRNAIGHGDLDPNGSWAIGGLDDQTLGMSGDLAAFAFADGVVWTAAQVRTQWTFGHWGEYRAGIQNWVDGNASKVVAYYPCDDCGNGTTMNDAGPDSYDGTWDSTADNTTDALANGDTAADINVGGLGSSTDPGGGEISDPGSQEFDAVRGIFFVNNFDDDDTGVQCLASRDDLSTKRSWQLRRVSGNTQVRVNGSTNIVSVTNATAKTTDAAGESTLGWFYDETTFSLVADGVVEDDAALGSLDNEALGLSIGRFAGTADEFAVNAVLSDVVAVTSSASLEDLYDLHSIWTGT